MSELIKLRDVSFAFPGKARLLDNINLTVNKGEFVGIVGATSSGKSTLLQIMCGVIPHFIKGDLEGTVELRGEDTRRLNLSKISRYIGVVSQDPENQLFNLIVKDEVAWALENRGVDPALMDERINAMLDFMHIRHLKERITYDLSGGEKQRLVLAATYVAEPEILFLDNPASMLDPVGAEMFIENVSDIIARGQTVVMIEDKIDELVEHADRIVVLDKGSLAIDCPTSELGQHIDTLLAANIRPPRLMDLRYRLQREFNINTTDGDGRESAISLKSTLTPYLSKARPAPASSDSQQGSDNFVKVEKLSFVYPPPRRVEALSDIDFGLSKGSFVAIVGQNGSGKTTLSRCMSGYLKPTVGRTVIDGQDITKLNLKRRAQVVGYVFQNPDHQIFLDEVIKDVAFGPHNLGWKPDQINAKVEDVLKKLALWEKRELHPYRLSKGDRQRLAIASVVVMEPKVLIVDEPTTGLDPIQARSVMDLLSHFRENTSMTIIVVTHAMDLVAEYCDRILVMLGGKLILDGPTREVFVQTDLLRQTRVQPPPITRFAIEIDWRPPPLTVDEAIQRLAPAMLEESQAA
jgi:energy-coupling factor transporter ATP-binding protein EcfA2